MLLTLDISTVQTGYCIGAPGRRPSWGVFRPGNLPRDDRIAYIADCIVDAARKTGVTQVIAEQVMFAGSTKKDGEKGKGNFISTGSLSEAHGAIRYALRPLKLTMSTFHMGSARSQLGIKADLGIKGAPKKDDVRRWLAAQGYPTVNGDEADALVIWLAVMLGKTATTPLSRPDLRPRLTPSTKPTNPGQAWLQG